MSRLIKFRAWDNENQCYHTPIYNASEGQLEELLINHNGRLAMWIVSGLIDESKFNGRFILEQFTGLVDKNGKEIFEGDIYEGDTDGDYYTVFFKNGSFCGGKTLELSIPLSYESEWIELSYCKVIGNIHENDNFGK